MPAGAVKRYILIETLTAIIIASLFSIAFTQGRLIEILRDYASDEMNLYATCADTAYLPRRAPFQTS